MQILGLGAIMLILPCGVGLAMLTHRTFDREALRLGCWILCTVIAAGFASCCHMAARGAADRAWRRVGCAVRARRGSPCQVHLSAGARDHSVRAMCATFLFARAGVRAAGEELSRSRTTTRRSWKKTIELGFARMGVSCADEHQGPLAWLFGTPIARWSQARRSPHRVLERRNQA